MFQKPSDTSQHLLHQYWDNLDPDLQDAYALAYNQSRREEHTIRTSILFAAMLRLKPEPLNALFDLLPKDALPNPTKENNTTKEYILREERCVTDSLAHIGQRASSKRKLSSQDVFVDIAKHGTGSSVKRLRTHGVSAKEIDQIVKQFGWSVIER